MINLCTSPSLTTKQLLDIISTDLIRLLCYCFLEFYWLLGDKSIALNIILWLYITLCANFHITEFQVQGRFSTDPCSSPVSMHGGQAHAAVDQTLGNILQQLNNKMKRLRPVWQSAPTLMSKQSQCWRSNIDPASKRRVRSSLSERKTDIGEWLRKAGV